MSFEEVRNRLVLDPTGSTPDPKGSTPGPKGTTPDVTREETGLGSPPLADLPLFPREGRGLAVPEEELYAAPTVPPIGRRVAARAGAV
ncbi:MULTISPECIES: hypothetical protein [unclassified Streptomyces]|uniref:hypothetical protein n=1 Tax=unclassified Streptomyces TaxID=2593676 RepID=UPI00166065E5|nr:MULTISPECIES: hypothetical protein [unclassified Streptomyces]MBD0708036.1 hypothetical protein [Streptomyces sp. CBMA291]MBD0715870.1 hypothetical protein [Streptomyces sp. CBMA370]